MKFNRSGVKALARGFLSLIPVAGPAVDSILSDLAAYQTEREIQRFAELINSLSNEIAEVKMELNCEYIHKDDFLDIFKSTARYVCNERVAEKRLLFRYILVNSMIDKDCDYDRTEAYFRLLERMSVLDILILKILKDPVTYVNSNPLLLQNCFKSDATEYMVFLMPYKSIDVLTSLTENQREKVEESVYILEKERLIKDALDAGYELSKEPVEVLKDKLTSKGRCFLEFISKA